MNPPSSWGPPFGDLTSPSHASCRWCLRLGLLISLTVFLIGGSVPASRCAELSLDFARMPPGPPPSEFSVDLNGAGAPVDWRVVEIPTGAAVESEPGEPRVVPIETVLTEMSEDPTDERFPLLIYQPLQFRDFTATLTFRTVRGRVEQMAGLAFRLRNPTNYYVVRASSLGSTFRFYKVVNGLRSQPIGEEIPIPVGEWHTLEVECKGDAIQCRLNGKDAIPRLNDSTFSSGRLALWTKSDSVTHFRRLHVVYDPVKTLPQTLVERALARYSRLKSITISSRQDNLQVMQVASADPDFSPRPAPEAEIRALETGQISVGKGSDYAAAVFPLTDHNGEPLFAVRLRMRKFTGQTDSNIAARGKIIADYLQDLVRTANLNP